MERSRGFIGRRLLASSSSGYAPRATSWPAAAASTLTRCAESSGGNLLDLAVQAARARATVGEITTALEQVWGRHVALIRSISGVYAKEVGEPMSVRRARDLVLSFAAAEGRRPRILIAKMGQDGHDRGQKVIATAFADLGSRRRYRAPVPDSGEAAQQAVDNDVAHHLAPRPSPLAICPWCPSWKRATGAVLHRVGHGH